MTDLSRRGFMRFVAAGAGCAFACRQSAQASTSEPVAADGYGMLIDTTACIGCRKCEWACAQQNKLSDESMESFEDPSVFENERRTESTAFTVVNRYGGDGEGEQPVYVKAQCMHCVDPACVSACLVGALQKTEHGAVVYDSWKCIGCRYCMVACPFDIPTYEFDDPLTPEVKKCLFCYERFQESDKPPACISICPPAAIQFGKRTDLLAAARRKITDQPDRYYDHTYGEHEVGGTSVLYLAKQPMEELGMPELGTDPIPRLTEMIQHSILKFGIPPLLLFAGLLTASKTMSLHEDEDDNTRGTEPS